MFTSLVTSLILAAGWAAAQQQENVAAFATVEGDEIHIVFDAQDGTPIEQLLDFARAQLGYPLLWHPADVKDAMLRGHGTKVIPSESFFSYLQNVLRAHDYVLVPYGTVAFPGHPAPKGAATGILAVRNPNFTGAGGLKPGDIKSHAPVVSADMLDMYRDDGGIVLTTSFRLEHVSVQEAMNMLQSYFMDPMVESVRAVGTSNSLVATGFATSLVGIRDLLRLIDLPLPAQEDRQVARFELRHAAAVEAKSIVDGLLLPEPHPAAVQQGAAPLHLAREPGPRVQADARTNALVVVAGASDLARVEACLAQLDTPLAPNSRTQVVRLQLAQASNLAVTLRKWAEDLGLERQVSVVADQGSNSLLITASDSALERVLDLVKQLDAR
ncbi:MAG: hypothetical protein HY812_07730 [Planctomycetes bacterium]|nr:hypothetical protein [Planctomycetota bacterium]